VKDRYTLDWMFPIARKDTIILPIESVLGRANLKPLTKIELTIPSPSEHFSKMK
jgi:hypothetical protein